MRYPFLTLMCAGCLAWLSLFFVSCHADQPEECYSCPSDADGKGYGTLQLSDSNAKWLSYCPLNVTLSGVRFTNGNGFTLNYSATKIRNNSKIKLPTGYDRLVEKCCFPTRYSDFYEFESEVLSYSPKDGGPVFEFYRKFNPDISITSADSLRENVHNEYLLFRFDKTYFGINIDTMYSASQQKFYSQLTLKSRSYQSVYQIIDTKVDSSRIVLQGFYFSFAKGLLGYYLTNGELWLAD